VRQNCACMPRFCADLGLHKNCAVASVAKTKCPLSAFLGTLAKWFIVVRKPSCSGSMVMSVPISICLATVLLVRRPEGDCPRGRATNAGIRPEGNPTFLVDTNRFDLKSLPRKVGGTDCDPLFGWFTSKGGWHRFQKVGGTDCGPEGDCRSELAANAGIRQEGNPTFLVEPNRFDLKSLPRKVGGTDCDPLFGWLASKGGWHRL